MTVSIKKTTNKFYIASKLSAMLSSILSSNDLLSAIRAENLREAINILAKKPLGSYVSGVYSVKGGSIGSIVEAIDEYTRASIKTLTMYLDKKSVDTLLFFEKIYDVLNIVSIYDRVSSGEKASQILPIGIMYLENVAVEDIDSLDKLYSILVRYNIFHKAHYVKRHGIEPYVIACKLLSEMDISGIKHPIIRKIMGLAHDYVLTRLALIYGEDVLRYVKRLHTYSLSELSMIASSRSVDELASILSYGYYLDYGSIVRDLQRIGTFFDVSHLIHVVHLLSASTDLLYPVYPCLGVRLAILLHGENLFAKLVLVSKYTGFYVREVEDIISKWWVV